MADVPRDPRQLARDILSGKIKIEDLARERQRQSGGVAPVARSGPQVPAKIPLPRQAGAGGGPVIGSRPPVARQPIPARQPMPARQPLPSRQPVAARTGRQVPPAAQQRGRAQGPQIEKPSAGMPAREREELVVPVGQAQAYAQSTDVAAAGRAAGAGPRRRMGLREMIKDRQGLRQGILMAEILGKPVGLR